MTRKNAHVWQCCRSPKAQCSAVRDAKKLINTRLAVLFCKHCRYESNMSTEGISIEILCSKNFICISIVGTYIYPFEYPGGCIDNGIQYAAQSLSW